LAIREEEPGFINLNYIDENMLIQHQKADYPRRGVFLGMGTAANDKNGKISGLQIRSATGKLVCIKSNNKARKLNGERKRKER